MSSLSIVVLVQKIQEDEVEIYIGAPNCVKLLNLE